MSADQAQREPTMEEILASIRRIISEEDKPAEAGGDVLDLQAPAPAAETKAPPPAPKPAPAPPPEPKPEPVVAKAPPPPVFKEPEPEPPSRALDEELIAVDGPEEVQEVIAPVPLPPVAKAPPAAPVAAAPKPEWRPHAGETLVSEPVASRAAGELGKLMGSMLISSGNTLDDVVRELLKPMLKEWLDANLPQLVEAEVAKEIDRIRRMAR